MGNEPTLIEIGEVKTAEAGQPPGVTLRGSSPHYIFDFTFPANGDPILIDDEISLESENPVQNKTIAAALQEMKQAISDAVSNGVNSTDAENGITVNEDGTLSVNDISILKIVQGTDDEVILYCGNSQ